MSADDKPQTQQTQPRGKDSAGRAAKPIEIPVPKREDFDKLIRRAVRAGPPQPENESK